jgi:hypothetical protein
MEGDDSKPKEKLSKMINEPPDLGRWIDIDEDHGLYKAADIFAVAFERAVASSGGNASIQRSPNEGKNLRLACVNQYA